MSEIKDKCVICLENLGGDMRTLPCKHKFHTHCYATWSERSRSNKTSCPCCRAEHDDPLRRQRNNQEHSTRVRPRNRMRRHNIRYYSHIDASPQRPHFMEPPLRQDLSLDIAEQIIRSGIFGHNREPSIKESIILTVILFIVIGLLYAAMKIHSTCICNVRWEPGETHRVEKYFFGGETTFDRPDFCTNIC